jgi:DNA-binding NtrC family response regulator
MTNNPQHPKPVSILVVEADPHRRQWIEHALSGGEYHVHVVASPKRGLQYLRRDRFDAVVIGEHLRAIGVSKWLSEARRLCPDLPVVVNHVNWPIGREYLAGSPGGFHCLVRSLQTQEVALRERIKGVVQDQERLCPANAQEQGLG